MTGGYLSPNIFIKMFLFKRKKRLGVVQFFTPSTKEAEAG